MTTRSKVLILSVALGLLVAGVAGANSDRITNGAFGTQSPWVTWYDSGSSGNPSTINYAAVAGTPVNSNQPGTGTSPWLYMEVGAGKNAGCYIPVPVVAGATYTLNGQFRNSNSAAKAWAEIHTTYNLPVNNTALSGNTIRAKAQHGVGGTDAGVWNCAFNCTSCSLLNNSSASFAVGLNGGVSGQTNKTIYLVLRCGASTGSTAGISFDDISFVGPTPAPAVPSITTQPVAGSGCGSYPLSVVANPSTTINGDTLVTYQWYNTSGVISGATSASYSATATASYYCIVTNGAGTTQSNTVAVTVYAAPTTATVGSAQTICAGGTTFPLGGNTPSVGTGAWSVVSGGTGTFSAPTSGSSTFTHTSGAGPVVLRWTISNGTCTASTADVSVTIDGTLLFSDNFQSPVNNTSAHDPFDQNAGVNDAGRQAGTLAPLIYSSYFNDQTTAWQDGDSWGSLANGQPTDDGYGNNNWAVVLATYYWFPTLQLSNMGINYNFNQYNKFEAQMKLSPDNGAHAAGYDTHMIFTVGQNTAWNWTSDASNIPSQGLAVLARCYGLENAVYYNGAKVASFTPPADINTNNTYQLRAVIDINVPAYDGASMGTASVTLVDDWKWSQPLGRWWKILTNYPIALSNNYIGCSAWTDHAYTGGSYKNSYADNLVISGSCTTPADKTVSAQASTVCSGTSTNIQVQSTENNVSYQLQTEAGANVGSAVTGTGGTINLPTGNLTVATQYKVYATRATCNATMSVHPTVAVVQQSTTATAGGPQTICASGTTLALGGNTPSVGTGSWSVVSGGTGTFSAPTSGSSTFTHTSGAGPVVLRWTISNGVCASAADVTVTVNQPPTVASVGGSQSISVNGTTTALGGNTPSVGTGAWSIVSGGTGTFSAPTSGSSTFTHTSGTGPVVLRWTISNGTCTASTADVSIWIDGLLFSDNFNSPANWDQNIDVGYAGRQAGSLAPLTYDSYYYGLTPQQKIDLSFYSLADGMIIAYNGSNNALNFFTYYWDTMHTRSGINNNFNQYSNLEAQAKLMPDNNGWPLGIQHAAGYDAFMYLAIGQDTTWNWGLTSDSIPTTGLAVVVRRDGQECAVYYNGAKVASILPGADGNGNYSPEWISIIDYDATMGTASVKLVDGWQYSQPLGRSLTVLTGLPVSFANNYIGIGAHGLHPTATQPNYADNIVIFGSCTNPADKTVSAQASSVCSGTGTNIQVQSTETNVSYQLQTEAGASVGSAVTGTGGTINLPTGNLTVATQFQVYATRSTCNATMSAHPTVTVNPLPAAPTGASANSRCGTGTVAFQVTPDTSCTVKWYAASTGGSSISTDNPYSPSISATTTYYAASVNASGCESALRTACSGTVNAIPDAPTAGSDTPVCEGGTLNLTASTIADATYSWTGPNGFTSSEQNPTVSTSATTAMSGSYTVTVTNGTGCTNTASTSATVNAKPTASPGGPYTVLQDGSLQLSGSGGGGTAPYSYSWGGADSGKLSATNVASPTFDTTADGTFNLTLSVTSASGCSSDAAPVTVTVGAVICEVKKKPDGDPASLSGKVVTAILPGAFYIEEEDGACGIRVVPSVMPVGLALGDRIDVVGTIRTNSDSERYIDATSAGRAAGAALEPVALTNKTVGGGDYFYVQATGAGQKGVLDGIGLNNIGLLVRTTGAVAAVGLDYIIINDGSNARGGSVVNGIRISCAGLTKPVAGQSVVVTGISPIHNVRGNLYRCILVTSQDRIVINP